MKSIVPIILIIAVAGLFFFEVKPSYSEVQELRAESADYDHALEMAGELSTLRDELERKLATFTQSDLERLNHFLPQQLDSVRIILDVDGIGNRNGVKLSNIKVVADTTARAADKQTKPGAAAYQTVDLSFDFTSTYPQAVALLKDLERSLRLLDSAKVDISPVNGLNPSLFNFKMSFKTYWINK